MTLTDELALSGLGVSISHIDSRSPWYGQVWELREEILRKPLGLSLKNEDLGRDHLDTIFIALHNDKVVACLLLHHIDNDVMQLRAMAVYNEWQGRGIGKMLVAAAEHYCIENGYNRVMLHSRKVAAGFYERMGYGIAGDEFVEVGIPHYIMEKGLEKDEKL